MRSPGAALDPMAAFLLIRGMKTLHLRMVAPVTWVSQYGRTSHVPSSV